jgi:hypothetical protein
MVAAKNATSLSDRLLDALSKSRTTRGAANEWNLPIGSVLSMPEAFQKIKKTLICQVSGAKNQVELLVLNSLQSLVRGLHQH